MTDKHTPGPWVYEQQGGFGTKHKSPGTRWVTFPLGYISKAPHSQPFLEIEPEWKEAGFALVPAFQKLPIEELDANARLIAAAPDLLEALKDARAQLEAYELDRTGETYNSPTINAAISKATGGVND